MKNLTAENRGEIIRLSFENCTWMERSSRNFQSVRKQKKILDNICFSEQMFYRKQSLGAPLILSKSKPSFLLSTKAQAKAEA